MTLFGDRKRPSSPRDNSIIWALDLDNLGLNIDPNTTRLEDVLDGATKYLSSIGRIVKMYAFGPEGTLATHADILRPRGFVLVQCPKLIITRNKGMMKEKSDTVDPELMRVCATDVSEMTHLTHFALGSGDGHFEGFIRWVEQQSVKIIIVAGDRKSLNPRIKDVASCDPDGNRMLYFLSPEDQDLQRQC